MNKKKFAAILAGVLAAVMVMGLLLGLLPGSASAASSSEIQNQIDQLEQEQASLKQQIAELESNLVQNKKDIQSMVARKNGIDQQVALLHGQLTVVKQTVTAYNLMIADKQDELDSAEKRLELLYAAYKDRIRAMEEQGEISYWAVIFEANSFFELLDHLNMVAEIAKADRQRLDEIRKVAQQVETAREELEEHKVQLELQRQELEAAEANLLVKQAEAEGLLIDLLAQGEDYNFEMDESEKLQHELMDQLAGLEKDKVWAEYLEWLATSILPTTTTTAAPTTTAPTTAAPTTIPVTIPKPTVPPTTKPKPTTTSTAATTTAPQKDTGKLVDGYVWYIPLPSNTYRVSSEFGKRVHPVTGKVDSYHKGIDLAAAKGTPIFATRDGVVLTTDYQAGGAGYYVRLGHDGGYTSIYMHMTHYIVKTGEYVQAGQIIGYVGSTGGSTGPHLHFGISYNGTYVNPANYISF